MRWCLLIPHKGDTIVVRISRCSIQLWSQRRGSSARISRRLDILDRTSAAIFDDGA